MILLLPLTFTLALLQAGETPPIRQAFGTCEIRGRVTDKENGRAIPQAVVRLSRRGEPDMRIARTDDGGKYEFRELPPGRYSGFVDTGPFRAAYLMAPLLPSRDATAGSPIVLKDGDHLDINVALERTLAITVRVLNEWGQPLAGVGVTVNSETALNSSFHRSMSRGTDDRGRARLFGIPPGRYIVCAVSDRISLLGDASNARRDRYLRTCYPSAAGEAQAEPVTLGRSDIEDLEIRMRRGRTFTISGTVLDASGNAAPSSAFISFTAFAGSSASSVGNQLDARGRFTFVNVPPGEYAIAASLGGPDQPEERRDLERGFQAVRVEASDIDGFVIAMAKAVNVAGRVVPEDPAVPIEPSASQGSIYICACPAGEQLPMGEGREAALAGDDRVFVLTGLFGRRLLEVANVPRGWYVKSIRYRGEEILDVPTEFKAGTDPSELQVILSTRGAIVSGRVVDDRGEGVANARVFLLPADPSHWNSFEVTSASASETGAFRVGPQRSGDYLILALPASVRFPYPDENRSRLKQLMETAERISLGSEEQRSLDVHVIKDR